MITLHYHRPGKGTATYLEQLVDERPDVKVLLMDYAGTELRFDGKVVLETGASIVWFVFPDSWFDVGRLHLRDGTFTGWYTNLCTPVVIKGNDWFMNDLFLDLWLPKQGSPIWLDQDEFEQAVSRGILEPQLVKSTLRQRDQIVARLAASDWPPLITRQVDLAHRISSHRKA